MRVESYCSPSGVDYVAESLKLLPVKAAKKAVRQFELIERYGLDFVTRSGTMKKIHRIGLYELTVRFENIFYRVFCLVRGAVCWLVHAFTKKSNKIPTRELETALNRSGELDHSLRLAK
jgi:phage-related protein